MQRFRFFLVMALVGVMLLAACGGDDGDTDDGGDAESGGTLTPTLRPTVPPEWTDTPPGFVPTPSDTPAPTASPTRAVESGEGAQLPPTWTPQAQSDTDTGSDDVAGSSSNQDGGVSDAGGSSNQGSSNAGDGSVGSSNQPTVSPAPTWTPQPEYCYELAPIGGDQEILAEQSVVITFEPIPRFADYLVEIRHPGGGVTHSGFATGGSYQVPGDVFRVAGVYGWEVRPLDENGNIACFPISGEIIVKFE